MLKSGTWDALTEECPVCCADLVGWKEESKRVHVIHCLEEIDTQVEYEMKRKKEIEREEEERVTCVICTRSLEDLPLEERHKHVNTCLEGQEEYLAERMKKSQEMSSLFQQNVSSTNNCTYCSKNLEGKPLRAKVAHVKRCMNKVKRLAKDLVQSDMDIECWLSSLGLQKYASMFLDRGLQMNTILQLTDSDLETMGIVALGPRKKIMASLAELNAVTREVGCADKELIRDTDIKVQDEEMCTSKVIHKVDSDETDCQIIAVKRAASNASHVAKTQEEKKAAAGNISHVNVLYNSVEDEDQILHCTPQFGTSKVAKTFAREEGNSLWQLSWQQNPDSLPSHHSASEKSPEGDRDCKDWGET